MNGLAVLGKAWLIADLPGFQGDEETRVPLIQPELLVSMFHRLAASGDDFFKLLVREILGRFVNGDPLVGLFFFFLLFLSGDFEGFFFGLGDGRFLPFWGDGPLRCV
jgi:hypothetical protein